MQKKLISLLLMCVALPLTMSADNAAVLKKLNSRYKSVTESTFSDGRTYYLVSGTNGTGACDAQGMPFIAVKEASLTAQTLAGVDFFEATAASGSKGIYSAKGEVIVPKTFDEITPNVAGGNLYFLVTKGVKHGLYNAEGKAVVAPECTALQVHTNAYLSWVLYEKNGKKGALDMLGAVLVPCEYDQIDVIQTDCNRAYFSVKKGTMLGAYSLSGSQLVKPAYTALEYDCTKGFYTLLKKKPSYLKVTAPEYQQFADLYFSPRYVHRLPANGKIEEGLYSLSLGAVEKQDGSRELVMAVNDGSTTLKTSCAKATYSRVQNSGIKTGIWREKDRWSITGKELTFVFHRYVLQGSSLETYITEVYTAEGEQGLYAQFDVENQDGNFSWKDFMNFVDSAIARGLMVK